jgi:sortase A
MAEVKINGYNYIGYLSIPALELELPIMSSWSYRQLKIAPCRYSGSLRGEDLVLMAHNYSRHFGKISKLNEGDTISFTDVDGVVTYYQVAAMDILEPTAVEVMTSGEFDLTLFTCTYGGGSRVTVCCNKT